MTRGGSRRTSPSCRTGRKALLQSNSINPLESGLTNPTATPGPAAASATSAASPAASTTTPAASAASAAAPLSDFLAELRLCGIFLVEGVERRQADVRDFLVAKEESMRL